MAHIDEGYWTLDKDDDVTLYETPARFWCAVEGPAATERIKRRSSTNNFVPAHVYRDESGNLYAICGGAHLIPKNEYIHIDGDYSINFSAMTYEQRGEYNKYNNYFIDIAWIENYAKRTNQTQLEAAREVWSYRKAIHGGRDMYDGIICGWDVISGVKLPEPNEPFVVRF